MHQEKYNLNWHTYSDHLKEMLHDMMKTDELTDVTLVCDDKRQFKAHKIVLSACSSIFKSIINDLPQNSSVIYLRGIQHQEMESILEFMYLGVATFYQERMNEFLNVAKNLEIKEISKDVEFNDGNVCNEETEIPENEENIEEEAEPQTNTDLSRNARSIDLKDNNSQIQMTSEGVKHVCKQCDQQFSGRGSLYKHIKSKHEGVKYACTQCDYQGTYQDNLKIHIKSKHEGMKYACNQCDFKATHPSNLITHIRTKHEGMRYACNQCEYQATTKTSLNRHIQSQH